MCPSIHCILHKLELFHKLIATNSGEIVCVELFQIHQASFWSMRHRHRTGARSLFTIEFSSSDSSDTDDSHVVHPGETCAKGRNLIEFSSSDASVTDDEVAVSRTSPVKPTPPPEEEPETHEDDDSPGATANDIAVLQTPAPPSDSAHTEETNESQDSSDDRNSDYRAFLCVRNARKGLSHVTFQFNLDQKAVLYARTKSLLSNTVYISRQPDIHVSTGAYEYIMTVGRGSTEFNLSKKGAEDQLELSLAFTNDYGNRLIGPRKIDMQFWEGPHLKSRVPKQTKSGRWVLKFNGKYVVKSQKNAIMLNEENHAVILIRKIQDTVLEIETIENYTDVHLFALGIASWICPL